MAILATLVIVALVSFRPGAPPGPPKLPLVGSLQVALRNIRMKKCGFELINDLAKEYGPVFHFKLGSVDSYVVSDIDLMKQVLSSDDWADRTKHKIWATKDKVTTGIIWNSGAPWREIRRYTLTTLKKFGFGRNVSLDSMLSVEMEDIKREILDRMDGNEFVDMSFHTFFSISTLNLIWSWMAAERFDRNDLQALELLRSAEAISRETPTEGNLVFAFPALLFFFQSTVKRWFAEYRKMIKFLRGVIERKRQSMASKNGEPEDYFEAFIKDIDEKKMNGPVPNYYTENQLVVAAKDLIVGGSDTSSSELEFGVLAMALHQDVQEQLRAEIEQVVGTKRFPVYSDLPRLPYAHATTLEILRMANALTSTNRAAVRDGAKIGDYVVTKGTSCYVNIAGYHLNPNVWENPMEFNPSRFLDSEHSLVNTDKIIPFGHGKRLCPGEQVGKAAIFAVLAGLQQTFKINPIPDDDLHTSWMKFQDGFTISPKPYIVRVSLR